MSGWVKLHRQIRENALWQDKPYSKGQAWLDMIMDAWHGYDENGNEKPETTLWIRGIPVVLKIGQLAVGAETYAGRWGWSRGKVERFLRTLKTVQQIEQQTVQQNSRLIRITTIKNWHLYQGKNTTDGTTSKTTDGTTKRQQTVQEEECKNEKNEKNTYGVRSETQSLFESINGMCDQYAIENGVRMKSLDPIVERYLGKVRMKVESQHCISWLIDRGLRKVTTQRLGNWFKKSQEIQKRDQLKQLEWKEAQNNPYQKKRAGELRDQNIRNPECFPIDSDM